MRPEADRFDLLRALGSAFFLACSWTWCIGMWFPVYMVRDWGWPGWAAFLIPNAIGAALVGAIHSHRSSPGFVAANLRAMRAFSIVTILFHVSWLAWLLSLLFSQSFIGQGWVGGAVTAATVLAGVMLSRVKRWGVVSVIVYFCSVLAAIAAWRTGPTLRLPLDTGTQPFVGLLLAMPLLALGFGLCPHLDLTFHRTRQESPGAGGTAGFALGFGLLFPMLMVFSLLYSGGLQAGSWSLYLLPHFVFQSAFTLGAHLRELRPGGLGDIGQRWPRNRMLLAVGIILMFTSVVLPSLPHFQPGTSARRLVYELFISFYALVFPAYVWIVSIGRGVTLGAPVRVWIAACALAAPCLWLGYIERWYVWLVPAVGIVLIAPIVPRFIGKRAP